jgi:hypothetical protein
MFCRHLPHLMVNTFHHPTCHLQIVQSSSVSVGSTREEELWRLGSPSKALRCQIVGPRHQGNFAAQGPLLSNSWTTSSRQPSPSGVAALHSAGEGTTLLVASSRASLSCSTMGALASRISSQSAFSKRKKMMRHTALEGVLHLVVLLRASSLHEWRCGRHKSGSSARIFHDHSSLALRTQRVSLVLRIVAWSSFDLLFVPS